MKVGYAVTARVDMLVQWVMSDRFGNELIEFVDFFMNGFVKMTGLFFYT